MSCRGIWFDNGKEWEILEDFGFYIRVYDIFFS